MEKFKYLGYFKAGFNFLFVTGLVGLINVNYFKQINLLGKNIYMFTQVLILPCMFAFSTEYRFE